MEPAHCFPDGAIVSLSTAGRDEGARFLSPRYNPNDRGPVSAGLVTRDACSSWESFRLSWREGGTVTLQNCGGRFLSPTHDGANWTFRDLAPDGGWEHLTLVPQAYEHGLPTIFIVGCQVLNMFLGSSGGSDGISDHGEVPILGVRCDASEAFRWRISLVGVPLLNLGMFGGLEQLSILRSCQTISAGPPGSDMFVRLLLRAMTEAGSFYLIGANAPGGKLFSALQAGVGHVPWRDDAASTDADRKTHSMLMEVCDTPGGVAIALLGCKLSAALPQVVWEKLVVSAFDDDSALCEMLLHALALAQQLAYPDEPPPRWRGAWSDGNARRALRALVYHPGPLLDTAGQELVTTARHTDATWLTLLREDDVGGLFVNPPGLGNWVAARPPVTGAVLVNSGNVLATATRRADGASVFGSVCHMVKRVSDTATRVSMPFFYDRIAGASFYGGGTGGC